MERIARWHELVVAGPTLDLRIQLIDHSLLQRLEVSAEHRSHIGSQKRRVRLRWSAVRLPGERQF